MVLSRLVYALPNAANTRILDALIYIDANVTRFVKLVTFVAGTHEASESVGAVSVLAKVFMFLTLVNIL